MDIGEMKDLEPFELMLATAYLVSPCRFDYLRTVFQHFGFDSLDCFDAIQIILGERKIGCETKEEFWLLDEAKEEGKRVLSKHNNLQERILWGSTPVPEDMYFGNI